MQHCKLDSQALGLFLECCHHRAIQPLAAAAQGGLSQHALQELLTRLAETVQVSCVVFKHASQPQSATVCFAYAHGNRELLLTQGLLLIVDEMC